MQNGYFRMVNTGTEGAESYGLKFFPPLEGGEPVRINEVTDYLTRCNQSCDLSAIKNAVAAGEESVVPLGTGVCPSKEAVIYVNISENNMQAVVRIIPPSETGGKVSVFDVMAQLRLKQIVYGINEGRIERRLEAKCYCTDILAAEGAEPKHGEDARIEYYFNTDITAKPTQKEDGSVDFFQLNTINHCKKGDLLAKLIPATRGEYGINVLGNKIKPRDVKNLHLKYSNNIEINEDKTEITAAVDGHVMLVEDKVFVSNVFEVENVDTSTGNIDYEGSVQVNGNVQSNFRISCRGNIIVNGAVEGACLEAGGDIIIARGMNGMNKGSLKAGGNVVAIFLENAKVEAAGYVHAEAIIHSTVMAGTEVTVEGKRGFIAGGRIFATEKVSTKNLGSEMGVSTIVEVGVDPSVKTRYSQLQKEIAEVAKELKTSEPVIISYLQKKKQGVQFSMQQTQYLKVLLEAREQNLAKLEEMNAEMQKKQILLEKQGNAQVVVTGDVFPGVKIGIGDVSTVIQSKTQYCRFVKLRGDVKVAGL